MDIFTDKYMTGLGVYIEQTRRNAWDYDNDEWDGVVAATTVDNDDQEHNDDDDDKDHNDDD